MVVQDYSRAMARRGLARGTIDKRTAELRSWLVFTEHDWRTASVEAVERWLDGRELGATSRYCALSHLHRFYQWAIREGLADSDPTATIERPRLPHRLPRPAPLDGVNRAIERADPWTRLVLCLMADAGLRCVEVTRLKRRDVDLTAGTLYVTGKGDRDRVVGIPYRLRCELYLAVDDLTRPAAPVLGREVSPARLSQLVAQYLRSTGLGATAHQLRHTYATRLYAATGGDLIAVQYALGHASVTSTQIYAAIDAERALDVARRLDS